MTWELGEKMMKNRKKNKNKPERKKIAVSKNVTEEQLEAIGLEAERIYQMFIDNMGKDLDDPAVYACVIEWQNYISKYYYNCTDMILAKLGNLYVNDKRFTEEMDQFQIGLAGFMSQAIKAYLRRNLPKLPKAEPVVKEEVKEESVQAPKKKTTRKKAENAEETTEKKAPAKKRTTKKADDETKPAKKAAAKKSDEEKAEKKTTAKKTATKKTTAKKTAE